MKLFAKLYDYEHGQILAVREDQYGDDGVPAITMTYSMPDEAGVMSTTVEFKDDERGHKQRDKAFGEMTKEKCVAYAVSNLAAIFGEPEAKQ